MVGGLLAVTACSGRQGSSAAARQKGPDLVPVNVARVAQKTVPIEVKTIGNVEAYSTVGVKSMINAAVERVYFKEGQDVSRGSLLFTLDMRPASVQLQQAQATMARDAVQAANAAAEARRYAALYKEGAVSRQQYDQFRTAAQAFTQTLRADRDAIQNARVQLSYAHITAPLSGRTGNLNINAGNVVKAQDTTSMVTINQMQPIYVTCSLPEQQLPDVQRRMRAGQVVEVTAAPPNQGGRKAHGKLTFIDNAVDRSTGTIKLKASFPNQDESLWPGQFVDVVVLLARQPNAVVVPAQAVVTGQTENYVYVVKADGSADYRPVKVTRNVGSLAVIASGLKPGETVVTDGQLRLVPGAKVRVKKPGEQGPTAPGGGNRRGGQAGGQPSAGSSAAT